jgi:hypothetical protein
MRYPALMLPPGGARALWGAWGVVLSSRPKRMCRIVPIETRFLMKGASLGACVGLCFVAWLARCDLVGRVGVTGDMDLRGRVLPVSCCT